MNFIRPEALSTLLRWREMAIGLGAAALGLWWIVTDAGLMRWVGVAFVLGGMAIAREGYQRALRPRLSGGPGVVEVDERQITYLSADGGGAVSVESLVRVHIETTHDGPYQSDIFWVFTPDDGPALHIPGDAAGADKLFDALAPLNDVDYPAAVRAAGQAETGHFLIWEKAGLDKPRRLH